MLRYVRKMSFYLHWQYKLYRLLEERKFPGKSAWNFIILKYSYKVVASAKLKIRLFNADNIKLLFATYPSGTKNTATRTFTHPLKIELREEQRRKRQSSILPSRQVSSLNVLCTAFSQCFYLRTRLSSM